MYCSVKHYISCTMRGAKEQVYTVTERKIGFRVDRLIALRKAVKPKLSQAALAEALGVFQQDVSGWEVGDHVPGDENIVRLADYFDVTTDYLLGKVDEPKQESNIRQHPELLDQLWAAVQKKDSVEAMELLARLLKGDQ